MRSARTGCRRPGSCRRWPSSIANLIILWTGWDTVWKLGVTILIGYAILVGNRVLGLNPHKPTLDWRAASWLPPYLIGMGLILYFSDFGPKGDDALIPFGWDMLVVGVLELVIYYWAMEVALPTEMIEEMIGGGRAPRGGDADADALTAEERFASELASVSLRAFRSGSRRSGRSSLVSAWWRSRPMRRGRPAPRPR